MEENCFVELCSYASNVVASESMLTYAKASHSFLVCPILLIKTGVTSLIQPLVATSLTSESVHAHAGTHAFVYVTLDPYRPKSERARVSAPHGELSKRIIVTHSRNQYHAAS